MPSMPFFLPVLLEIPWLLYWFLECIFCVIHVARYGNLCNVAEPGSIPGSVMIVHATCEVAREDFPHRPSPLPPFFKTSVHLLLFWMLHSAFCLGEVHRVYWGERYCGWHLPSVRHDLQHSEAQVHTSRNCCSIAESSPRIVSSLPLFCSSPCGGLISKPSVRNMHSV